MRSARRCQELRQLTRLDPGQEEGRSHRGRVRQCPWLASRTQGSPSAGTDRLARERAQIPQPALAVCSSSSRAWGRKSCPKAIRGVLQPWIEWHKEIRPLLHLLSWDCSLGCTCSPAHPQHILHSSFPSSQGSGRAGSRTATLWEDTSPLPCCAPRSCAHLAPPKYPSCSFRSVASTAGCTLLPVSSVGDRETGSQALLLRQAPGNTGPGGLSDMQSTTAAARPLLWGVQPRLWHQQHHPRREIQDCLGWITSKARPRCTPSPWDFTLG